MCHYSLQISMDYFQFPVMGFAWLSKNWYSFCFKRQQVATAHSFMLRTASQYEGVINPGLLALVTCAISCKLFAFNWIPRRQGTCIWKGANLFVSLWCVNLGFWSHLGCSREKRHHICCTYVSVKVSVKVSYIYLICFKYGVFYGSKNPWEFLTSIPTLLYAKSPRWIPGYTQSWQRFLSVKGFYRHSGINRFSL